MFGIIFWSSLWVVLLCLYFTAVNGASWKKNMVLGVTLPYEAREDPGVVRILGTYRKQLRWICGLLGLISVGGAFLRDLAVSMICWCVVFLVILAAPNALMIWVNGRLKRYKVQMNWRGSGAKALRVDISAWMVYEKPRSVLYLPPALICLGMALIQRDLWYLHGLMLLTAAGCFLSAGFLYRKKSEMVDGNQELTRQLSLLRYQMWNQMWLLAAYGTASISLAMWLVKYNAAVGAWILVFLSVLHVGITLMMEFRTRRLQEKLTEQSGQEWYVDDDDHWLGGMFYYNPQDSHVLINNRVGTGSTWNLATTPGKLLYAFVGVALLGTVVLVLSIALMDKSPIALTLHGETLRCENANTVYEVPVEEIEEITLETELPENLYRTNGLGGQHLLKGKFNAQGMPDLRILADPTNPPYLLIRTVSGQFYLLNTRAPGITREIYEQLVSP